MNIANAIAYRCAAFQPSGSRTSGASPRNCQMWPHEHGTDVDLDLLEVWAGEARLIAVGLQHGHDLLLDAERDELLATTWRCRPRLVPLLAGWLHVRLDLCMLNLHGPAGELRQGCTRIGSTLARPSIADAMAQGAATKNTETYPMEFAVTVAQLLKEKHGGEARVFRRRKHQMEVKGARETTSPRRASRCPTAERPRRPR